MMASWVLLVPGYITVENWVWLNAGVVAFAVTAVVLLGRLTPTLTIAEVLYEVERMEDAVTPGART